MSDRGRLRLIIVRSCFGMKCVLLTKLVIYEHIKLTVGASKTELGIKGYKMTEYRSTTGRKPKVVGEAEPITAVYALFLPLNVG